MKLFGEKVEHTFTNSPHNILQVKDYNEIFFDVYEIELNNGKYPVEKISEESGMPVVSIPIIVEGVEHEVSFVLSKGDKNFIFLNVENKNLLKSDEPSVKSDESVEINLEIPQILHEDVDEPSQEFSLQESKKEILDQIEEAKKQAIKQASRIKKKKLEEADADISKRKKALDVMLESARGSLVEEFLNISKKIKKEFISENDNRWEEIKETIDNKIGDMSISLSESLKTDFSTSEKQFDKKIRELIKELYKSLQPKIDNDLKDIANQIVEKVDSIESSLNQKVEKSISNVNENITEIALDMSGKVNTVKTDLNEKFNKLDKNVNKSLSRVGSLDRKIDKAIYTISEEIDNKIQIVENDIEKSYGDKLKLLENKNLDINDKNRKYLIDLITESKHGLIEEVRKISKQAPIEYVVEANNTKKNINRDDIVKDLDKKINFLVGDVETRLRKYVAVYVGGGGTVATQYQDGGTMNGNLTIVGSISASEYLGIPYPSENDTLDIVTSRGNITNNSIKVNTLSANSAHLTSVIEASAFVTTGGTSSDFVKGDGSLDSNTYITEEAFLSNLVLYPTTAVSDISGYSKMVASVTDIDYDTVAVDVSTGSITGTDVFISSLISAPDLIVGEVDTINLTVIGNIKKVSGGTNKNASFHFHAYKRSIGGVETLLGVSSNTVTVASAIYEEYNASLVLNTSDWIDTDRLVLKLYGTLVGSGGGSSPVFNFLFGGDTPVRVLLPLPTNVQLSNYIPYVGASKDINLGTHDVTTTGNISASGNITASSMTISGNPVATVVDPVRTTLTGNGILSTFSINGANNIVNPSALIVAIDGALQEPVVDYTVSGGSITFTEPLDSGAKAVVISPTNTLQVSQMIPTDGSVTSNKLDTNLTIAGSLSLPNQSTNNLTGALNQNTLLQSGNKYRMMTRSSAQNNGVGSSSDAYLVLGMGCQISNTAGSTASSYTYESIASHAAYSGAPMKSNMDLEAYFHGVMLRVEANENWVMRINFGVGSATRVPPLAGVVAATARQWGVEIYYDTVNNDFKLRMYWYDSSINYGTPVTIPALTAANLPGLVYSIRMRQTSTGLLEFYISTPNGLGEGAGDIPLTPLTSMQATWTNVSYGGRHINFEVAAATAAAPSTQVRIHASTMQCAYK
jgi:hypothetical protein